MHTLGMQRTTKAGAFKCVMIKVVGMTTPLCLYQPNIGPSMMRVLIGHILGLTKRFKMYNWRVVPPVLFHL